MEKGLKEKECWTFMTWSCFAWQSSDRGSYHLGTDQAGQARECAEYFPPMREAKFKLEADPPLVCYWLCNDIRETDPLSICHNSKEEDKVQNQKAEKEYIEISRERDENIQAILCI